MRKSPIILCLLFILVSPFSSLGATKNVTITWEMTDTANVTGYRMYYAYDSNMTDKLLACETTDTTATSLTCENIELTQSPAYFVIAALTAETEGYSPPSAGTFVTTISTVQGFSIEMPALSPEPAPIAEYKINFQPADAPVPEGYQPCSKEDYDPVKGYGWTVNHLTLDRDRDNPLSADQAYDTLLGVYPDSVFEYAVPNGTYNVTVCIGDASYPMSTNSIQIEGVPAFTNQEINDTTRWKESTISVQVDDGRLTLTFTGSDPYSQLCWLKFY